MDNMDKIEVKVINTSANPLPTYSKEGDACVDLRADLHNGWDDTLGSGACWDEVAKCLRIFSGGRALISSGLHVQVPKGYMFKLMERSGLSAKGLKLSGGTIDSGYIGLVYISLINLSDDDFEIHDGDRIAQASVIQVPEIKWVPVTTFNDTQRGDSGFNSTGVK